ncbi:unannotated protein [freshwater metagenome]|uniref:Unannotated protein n=1 Tax=freshwater metagenome TaxID=449393 RepID=A0A6J6S5M6_9ZZZZ
MLLAGVCIAVPVLAAACGDDATTQGTLPPIATTTTTTTILQTTTTYPDFYTLQSGDTLGKVAKRFGTTIDELMALNNITDKNKVQAGQDIKLPPQKITVPAATEPPTTSVPPST